MIDVEYRLERWADFMRVAHDFGLGFPRQTVENRETFGGGGHVIELPIDVQRTEEAVRRLDKEKLDIVRIIYVKRKSVKETAYIVKRSRTTINRLLDMAERQVMGYLDALEN